MPMRLAGNDHCKTEAGRCALFPTGKTGSDVILPRNAGRRAGTRAEYNVIAEKRLVIVKFGKRLTEREIKGYVSSLRAHPQFDPSFSEILDMSTVEEIDMRGEEMAMLADQVDPFSLDSKRAFVVHSALQSHEARMFQILHSSDGKIRSFASVNEAKRWILGNESPQP
jgi:hypothetical protein